MTEAKTKKPTSKKAVAKKALCTSKGMIKKGESFACSAKEYEAFKKVGAV